MQSGAFRIITAANGTTLGRRIWTSHCRPKRKASRGQTPSQLELEKAIESFAGHFAVEHRLEEMVAEGAARGAYRMGSRTPAQPSTGRR